ncbi:MAG: hypothetical protein C0627_06840 [Sulfurimonas sp.]|nr:MAG: hypothetical protein C0627_06840 [Sulfurimonas sp.]
MPISQITLKHNKHRIHPCPNDKKLSLLNLLIEQNGNLDILVVTAQNSAMIKEALKNENIKIFNDNELSEIPELKCELLISYDLPEDASKYLLRVAKATEGAVILLDISEQKDLYPIETLLKRVIRQEIVEGFEYEEQKMIIAQPAQKREYAFNADSSEKPKYDKKPFDKPKRDGEKSERKVFEKPKYDKSKKDEKKPDYKSFDKPKYDKPKFDKPRRDDEKKEEKSNKFAKSDKKPNKYLGKDENGKAKFSGKSKERNHRYDGKPKEAGEAPKNVGRKIYIKERKPKETPES